MLINYCFPPCRILLLCISRSCCCCCTLILQRIPFPFTASHRSSPPRVKLIIHKDFKLIALRLFSRMPHHQVASRFIWKFPFWNTCCLFWKLHNLREQRWAIVRNNRGKIFHLLSTSKCTEGNSRGKSSQCCAHFHEAILPPWFPFGKWNRTDLD